MSGYEIMVPVKLAERSWPPWQSRGPQPCERLKNGEAHTVEDVERRRTILEDWEPPIIPLPLFAEASAPSSTWRQLPLDPGNDRAKMVVLRMSW